MKVCVKCSESNFDYCSRCQGCDAELGRVPSNSNSNTPTHGDVSFPAELSGSVRGALSQELGRLAELKDRGALDEEEFRSAKAKLLTNEPSATRRTVNSPTPQPRTSGLLEINSWSPTGQMTNEQTTSGAPLTLALIGSGLLALGVFCPFLSVGATQLTQSIAGASTPATQVFNLWSASPGSGFLILVLAAVSIALSVALSVKGKYAGLYATSVVATLVVLYDISAVGQMGRSLLGALTDINLQWGWIPLLAGACLVFLAPIVRRNGGATGALTPTMQRFSPPPTTSVHTAEAPGEREVFHLSDLQYGDHENVRMQRWGRPSHFTLILTTRQILVVTPEGPGTGQIVYERVPLDSVVAVGVEATGSATDKYVMRIAYRFKGTGNDLDFGIRFESIGEANKAADQIRSRI